MDLRPWTWRVRLVAMLGMLAALAPVCRGQGYADTFALGAGSVTVSNSQLNSSWVPVAVLYSYAGSSTGTTAIWRVSQGHSHNLGTCSFTNVTSVIWVPDSDYSFAPGDVLLIQSSVTNGAVQVIRKGG